MTARKVLITIAGVFLLAGSAFAQQLPIPLTVSASTFSGRIVLSAGTSTSLIAANVTMDTNSAALPSAGGFTRLVVIPPSSGTVNICLFGGTCSATTGEQLGAGTNVGTDTFNLSVSPTGGAAVAPTLFSTAGATIYFRN